MAPTKRPAKPRPPAAAAALPSRSAGGAASIPAPFKRPPEALEAFAAGLSPKHVYIAHVDSKPASFKRKIFLVPVAINVCVALLFAWRMRAVLPWYWQLVVSAFGYPSGASFPASEASWAQLGWEIGRRGATMFVDFVLLVFVWPWPVEFAVGRRRGSPVRWRLGVGFLDREVYVRRSRDWDRLLRDVLADADSRKILTAYVEQATSPRLQEEKTGYLVMDSKWDLDWGAMVHAHSLVDKKAIAMDAFSNVVLLHHRDHGWLCYDLKARLVADEDDKRRQLLAFRDALAAMGKEALFYRWIEMVQFEATQPGGFGPEKQEAAAKKIRDLFEKENIDFDHLWKETVGADPSPVATGTERK